MKVIVVSAVANQLEKSLCEAISNSGIKPNDTVKGMTQTESTSGIITVTIIYSVN